MHLELQSGASAIAQQMILCNFLVDWEVVKLKKVLENAEKEIDRAVEANMKLADYVKKYEDRESCWARKLKKKNDLAATLKGEVDTLKESLTKAEEEIKQGQEQY